MQDEHMGHGNGIEIVAKEIEHCAQFANHNLNSNDAESHFSGLIVMAGTITPVPASMCRLHAPLVSRFPTLLQTQHTEGFKYQFGGVFIFPRETQYFVRKNVS